MTLVVAILASANLARAGLGTVASWTAEGEQDSAFYGAAVASAGDVNGDGYGDIVVGAYGQGDGGRAYVYLGSPLGLGAAAWTTDGDAYAQLGNAVASAGDVNGDGYDDLAVGAVGYDSAGRVELYLGSPAGLGPTPASTVSLGQEHAHFGTSLGGAGDVNGDGYADLIVGASMYDNDLTHEGWAGVYLGSAEGLASSPSWTVESDHKSAELGAAVASAGDVNGDGFGDVIVGSPGAHLAQVYLGSPGGLGSGAAWRVIGPESSCFGNAVAAAGDVNGDGYGDVLVGAWVSNQGEQNEGRAYLYLGAASGLSTTPNWAFQSDQEQAYFGRSVASAGDINGDGYDDVVVGADGFDDAEEDEGRAYVFLGSAEGLGPHPVWVVGSGQSWVGFGAAVSSAGDVDGDGYDDVIVGERAVQSAIWDEEGRASVILGTCDVEEFWYADIDHDGYTDPDVFVTACDPPIGYAAANHADCDDGDRLVHPGALDVVGDGIDQDCDGVDAEVGEAGCGCGGGCGNSGNRGTGTGEARPSSARCPWMSHPMWIIEVTRYTVG